MSMKNDVSFIIGMRLALYEHQSTYNPNMPLRFLFYVADLYSTLTRERNLFGAKRVHIQIAEMININKGHNKDLMDSCKTLRDYAEYIYRIRKYAEDKSIEEAVEQAIKECIDEDILKEFLEKNRAEAMAVSIYEYNEAEHMRMEREDSYSSGYEEGCREGRKEGRQDGLEEGQEQMLQLIKRMAEAGLVEDIPRLAKDQMFFEEMLIKYPT